MLNKQIQKEFKKYSKEQVLSLWKENIAKKDFIIKRT